MFWQKDVFYNVQTFDWKNWNRTSGLKSFWWDSSWCILSFSSVPIIGAQWSSTKRTGIRRLTCFTGPRVISNISDAALDCCLNILLLDLFLRIVVRKVYIKYNMRDCIRGLFHRTFQKLFYGKFYGVVVQWKLYLTMWVCSLLFKIIYSGNWPQRISRGEECFYISWVVHRRL